MYILPDLCDEFAEFIHVAEPIFRSFGGRPSFGGVISTIKCHEDNSLVAKAVDEPGEGRVLVVDGGGSLRCALVGDNLAEKAAGSGWAGIIVYGCIRDVDVIGGIELGVHALAANPMRSVKRDVGLRDEPVTFAGVTFTPGEFAYGDNNGIIVSSRSLPESAIS